VIALLIAAVAGGTVALVLSLGRGGRPTVELAEARQGDIRTIVDAPGVVRPGEEVRISSSIAGKVEMVAVAEGEKVSKGQLLIRLDRRTYEAQVREARAQLQLARAGREQSRAQCRRARELVESDLIARQEMETACTQYRIDQARVKQARAALDVALEKLDLTTIVSPIAGTVTMLAVDQGENVIPGTAGAAEAVLAVVADLSRMKVVAQVDEADVANVEVGQEATVVVDAFSRRMFGGTIVDVDQAAGGGFGQGAAQNGRVEYSIDVLLADSTAPLKSGMSATVEIATLLQDDVLVVPIASVVTRPVEQVAEAREEETGNGVRGNGRQETEAVFIVEGTTARLVPVRTGVAGERFIHIDEGLQPGQEVVVGPFSALRELESGEKVRILDTPNSR
jgi:HlyD family secretion protein